VVLSVAAVGTFHRPLSGFLGDRMTEDREDQISDLIGKMMTSVTKVGDEIIFTADNGDKWKFYHNQDCCESVTIEDICGELNDLVGSPIIMAEEVSNNEGPKKDDVYGPPDSFTWTFYKFATIKGNVTVRWYGTSNGYYSERVDFCKI
jgi:hypothetical protein